MIAVYYDTSASPYTIYTLKVRSSIVEDLNAAIERECYPFPEEDVVIIDNNKVVCQYNYKEEMGAK